LQNTERSTDNRYAEEIEKCRAAIALPEENPGMRGTNGMITGDQRAEEASWLNGDDLIAVARRKIARFQHHAALRA